MACFRQGCVIVLSLTLWAATAVAAEQTPGLYDRPVLVVDPGVHTARHWQAAADSTGTGRRPLRTTRRCGSGRSRMAHWHGPSGCPPGRGMSDGSRRRDQPGRHVGRRRWLDLEQGWPARADLLVQSCEWRARQADRWPAKRCRSPRPSRRIGHRLATTLNGSNGIRLDYCDRDWGEVARDEDYGDASYGAAFAPDARLATSSFDGKVRLYTAGLQGTAHPTVAIDAPDSHRPFGIRISPTDPPTGCHSTARL